MGLMSQQRKSVTTVRKAQALESQSLNPPPLPASNQPPGPKACSPAAYGTHQHAGALRLQFGQGQRLALRLGQEAGLQE